MILTWAGAKQIEEPFKLISMIISIFYFRSVLAIYFYKHLSWK
jgi:hypothetical protein